jgi:hypothetical protein
MPGEFVSSKKYVPAIDGGPDIAINNPFLIKLGWSACEWLKILFE